MNCDRFGASDVRAAGRFGHPLAARPERRRIPAREARKGAPDELLIAQGEEGLCRTIGHGERTAVDIGRGREEMDERELMDARKLAKAVLITGRHHAEASGELLRLLPERRELDLVDAFPPGSPLCELRFEESFAEHILVELAPRELAELAKLGFDRRIDLHGQQPPKEVFQRAIVVELIAQPRRALVEGLKIHASLLISSVDEIRRG